MRLTTATKVLTALALQDRGENLTSANEALEITAPIIANVLGMPSFDRTTYEDLFAIDRLWERRSSDVFFSGNVKLLLNSGLVCVDTTPRVESFENMEDAIENDNGTRIDKKKILTDFEDGWIKTTSAIGDWLTVRYDAGFTEKNGDYEDVPPWLSNAAVSAAIRYMRGFQQKWNSKDIADTKEEIHRMLDMSLTAHIRSKYGSAYPYHTKVMH